MWLLVSTFIPPSDFMGVATELFSSKLRTKTRCVTSRFYIYTTKRLYGCCYGTFFIKTKSVLRCFYFCTINCLYSQLPWKFNFHDSSNLPVQDSPYLTRVFCTTDKLNCRYVGGLDSWTQATVIKTLTRLNLSFILYRKFSLLHYTRRLKLNLLECRLRSFQKAEGMFFM